MSKYTNYINMYEHYFDKKRKISMDDFYSKVIKICWEVFELHKNFAGIHLGDNPMYHMYLRTTWREWIVEELHKMYEIEV